MTSGADSAVVDLLHTAGSTLPNNLRREIDLVMGRPNAGTELDDEIGRRRTKTLVHEFDRSRSDFELGAFLSRMHESDCRRFWIDDVNRAAVRNVNAEANAALICNDTIAAGKTFPRFNRSIHDRDLVAMNLLRGHKWK